MADQPDEANQAHGSVAMAPDPRSDVLADVLGAALLRNSVYRSLHPRAPWGLRVPAHGRAVFYLLARGSARLELEGEAAAILEAGDVAFVPHGTAHVLRDTPVSAPTLICDVRHPRPAGQGPRFGGDGAPATLIVGLFELRDGPRPSLLAGMPSHFVLSASDPRAQRWVGPVVQLLIAESGASSPASTLVQQRLADVLLVHALRALMEPRHCTRPGIAAISEPHVGKALALMHARITEPWTVASLAREAGLSRSSFAARFTEVVGEPPLQYLARWRVARAVELLEDARLRTDEVAARVGYRSVPSFIKAFKRWRGRTPGSFRKRDRGALAPDAAPAASAAR